MADAFAGLGSRVTVVEAATIAGKEDPELVAGLRDCLTADGGVTYWRGPASLPWNQVRRWSSPTAGGSPAAIYWSRSADGRTWTP